MRKRGYHHGNLRQALVESALQLIESKGPSGFTLSEAAKLAGVTPAAVYRGRYRYDLRVAQSPLPRRCFSILVSMRDARH